MDKTSSRSLNIAITVTAVLALCGLGLWVFQMVAGFSYTNMRNLDSWGIYLVNFIFMVGLSAGGLIISSIPRALGIEGFGGISKVAIWTSICCTVLAIIFVVIDVGRPYLVWELVVYGNFTSPLMWDFVILVAYLILSVLYLWATIRFEKKQGSERALRIISIFALVVAVLVHSVTAWIFGLQVSHEFWNTALLAPWFVSSALVSGLALVMIVVVALRKVNYLQLEDRYLTKMAKLLGILIAIDLFFYGCDLLTAVYSDAESSRAIVSMLTTGPLAIFFWVEVIGGIVACVILFTEKLRTTKLIVLAAALAILGIFCKRVTIILGGFFIRNIDPAPSLPSGLPLSESGLITMSLFSQINYVPSFLEFGIVVGILALGVMGVLLGIKFLPLKPAE